RDNDQQDTRYPWDGAVTMTIKSKQARRFQVHVRIPGWAGMEPVPSALYRFVDPSTPLRAGSAGTGPKLTVNGNSIPVPSRSAPVRRVVSNDQVIANRNRVALQRGPIVYAAEWPDNPNGKVRNIVLSDSNP